MATFQQLQSYALWRLRSRGALPFTAPPTNSESDQNPPSIIKALLNTGYNEFLSRTMESGIAVYGAGFYTNAGDTRWPLRPCPNSIFNDPQLAAMRVLEATYNMGGNSITTGQTFDIEICSTEKFKQITGAYTRRASWFGPRVLYATQLFGQPYLDIAPGIATSGDYINLTCVPDPENSPLVPCQYGGPMVNPGDVPLFPSQFHRALVEFVVMECGDASDKTNQSKRAEEKWEKYIAEALAWGVTRGQGMPEVGVKDTYYNGPQVGG